MGLKKIWGCGRFFLKGIRYKKISGKRGGLLFFSWNDKRNMMRFLLCAENDNKTRRNGEET
jgi:hypothetical protein